MTRSCQWCWNRRLWLNLHSETRQLGGDDLDGSACHADRERFGAPPSAPAGGTIAPIGATEEPIIDGDVRTLWIDPDAHGGRHKSFQDAATESTQEVFKDAPACGAGPLTALGTCRNLARHLTKPSLWLQPFCSVKYLLRTDRNFH